MAVREAEGRLARAPRQQSGELVRASYQSREKVIVTRPSIDDKPLDKVGRFQANANCRYHITIDKMEKAVFSEISGLQIETETMDVIEGGVNDRVLRLPVRSRSGNLTLKRGVTVGNELLNWHLKIVQGIMDFRTVTITAFRTSGVVLARYEFLGAYPVKWSGPTFASGNETVAVETLELAHQGIILLNA